jgi:hypothetical protein
MLKQLWARIVAAYREMKRKDDELERAKKEFEMRW